MIVAGIILCIASFGLLWNGCVERLRQTDWPIVDAIVVYVEEETVGSLKPGRAGTHKTYEIYYEYTVGGNTYSGDFKQNRGMSVGDSLEIKYNPDAPQYSTKELEPSVINMIIGGVAGVYGLTAIVASIVLAKRQR